MYNPEGENGLPENRKAWDEIWGWKHEDELHGKVDLAPFCSPSRMKKKKKIKNPGDYTVSSETN